MYDDYQAACQEVDNLKDYLAERDQEIQALKRERNAAIASRDTATESSVSNWAKLRAERDELRREVKVGQVCLDDANKRLASKENRLNVLRGEVARLRELSQPAFPSPLKERLIRWASNLERQAGKATRNNEFITAGNLTAIRLCVQAILDGREPKES